MERDCESELSKLNIEQNACIYHFGASVIHGQRSNILRLPRGGLNLKLVGGYVVSMPCFIEQQKIVACLSALDDVIEKKKATLAAWEELKKGLLQQMFV